MIIAGLVFAALAGVLHVYIFTMESLTWTTARTRAAFGMTPEEAAATKLLAFNQGFYNLSLAMVTGIGIVAVPLGHRAVGAALVFAGVGSMACAAVVLLASSPDKAPGCAYPGCFSGDRYCPAGGRPRPAVTSQRRVQTGRLDHIGQCVTAQRLGLRQRVAGHCQFD